MKKDIYNGSVQKLDKPESTRPSERIEFENGSVIECLKTNKETIRGNRSKHLECVCYDIENDKWIIGKPLLNENHIPEWIIAEILSKYDK